MIIKEILDAQAARVGWLSLGEVKSA